MMNLLRRSAAIAKEAGSSKVIVLDLMSSAASGAVMCVSNSAVSLRGKSEEIDMRVAS